MPRGRSAADVYAGLLIVIQLSMQYLRLRHAKSESPAIQTAELGSITGRLRKSGEATTSNIINKMFVRSYRCNISFMGQACQHLQRYICNLGLSVRRLLLWWPAENIAVTRYAQRHLSFTSSRMYYTAHNSHSGMIDVRHRKEAQ